MSGDLYVTQIQISDCRETLLNQVTSKIQQYSTLTLPFKLCNGSSVTISMVLCKFRILSPSLFHRLRFSSSTFVYVKFLQLAWIIFEIMMKQISIVADRSVNVDARTIKRVHAIQTVKMQHAFWELV